MPNCEALHRDVQVSWEIFGPAITIEVAARIGKVAFGLQTATAVIVFVIITFSSIADDEYVAFGLSGSTTEAKMEGGDVAILYMDTFQGYATDYNITAKSSVFSDWLPFL